MSLETISSDQQSGEKKNRPGDSEKTNARGTAVFADVVKAVYFLIRIAKETAESLLN